MDDEGKSKEELIQELVLARKRILELEAICRESATAHSLSRTIADEAVSLTPPSPFPGESAHDSNQGETAYTGSTLSSMSAGDTDFPFLTSDGDRFRDLAKLLPQPVLNSMAIAGIREGDNFTDQLLQAQKMEAVGTLAGGIAHDFNNILTAIIASASLIQRKMDQKSPMRKHLDRIFAAAERATILTQSILAYSRKQPSRPAAVKLNLIIANLHKMLNRLIPENITFSFSPTEIDLFVMADSGQMEQVVMNLVSNAIDAMPNGGSMEIATRLASSSSPEGIPDYMTPGEYAVLSVADTGTGMDSATRERLFEPFFTTKEVGHGTGLGLAMIYGIVKQHGGYVEVSSEPGRGSMFYVYLPLIGRGEDVGDVALRQDYPKGTETILLVEDDHDVRNLLKEMLEGFGYSVIEAVDGNNGIETFNAHKDKIDLILSDVMMPGKNGKEAYNQMRRMKRDVKVIFISGYSFDATKELLDEGMDFLAKPVSPQELLKKIREALER